MISISHYNSKYVFYVCLAWKTVGGDLSSASGLKRPEKAAKLKISLMAESVESPIKLDLYLL